MTATKINVRAMPLAKGSHNRDNGEACVMELASYIAGERWSDSPACVSPVIGAFLRNWNDSLPDDDRQQLKRYLACRTCGEVHNGQDADHPADVPLLNTKGTPAQEEVRAWMATDWLVRVQAPAWLRCAGLTEQAATLAGLPELKSGADVPPIKPALEAVRADARAARAAAGDAAGDAAGAAAGDAAGAAARAAAGDAARAAARDAARAAARAAAGDALRPTVEELQPLAHDLLARMIAVAS